MSFPRTFARLLAQRSRLTAAAAGGAAAILALWCWWATCVEITLHEISTSARVEADASAYPVQSGLLGRVVASSLRVGAAVRRGDVLVELDAAPEALQLRETQTRSDGVGPAIARLRAQLDAEDRARLEERRTADMSRAEASARLRAASADTQYADAELARTQALRTGGLISQRDLDKARFEAERRHADTVALESALQGVPQLQITRERERDVRIERLRASIESLESERRTLAAAGERLLYEIERRRIRAPADGVIGEAAILRPGSFVDEGTQVATIVAPGRLIVAAEFPPDAALGRIRVGQAGRLRLDAFAWAQFGVVPATVARVASEVRNGNVLVELTIDSSSRFGGRLQHGMPGSLDLSVERITPWALLLRTTGRALTSAQSPGRTQ